MTARTKPVTEADPLQGLGRQWPISDEAAGC